MNELPIEVRDIAGRGDLRPVTGGVPLAEGAAPASAVFALRDESGAAVPLQTRVLARWHDGSARWVLLDFPADPPAGGARRYALTWQGAGASPSLEAPVQAEPGSRPALRVGDLVVGPGDDGALLRIGERYEVHFELEDADGRVCGARADEIHVETEGPLRGTLQLTGAFYAPSGERVFQCRLRVSLYAGRPYLRLEPLILVDAERGVLQQLRALTLSLRPRAAVTTVRLGGAPGWEGRPAAAVRLFQRDDAQYRLEGAEGQGERAPGWAELRDASGGVALALRDFWQQWPKSLEASAQGLTIGLFPRFREGDYAHMEPWYKHQYLFEGECYRLRAGQARRWDLWLDLSGDGEALAAVANTPLVPAAVPAAAIATGVWDTIGAAGTAEMADYDAWAGNLLRAYEESLRVQRDYGAMNWGDWFGERQVNWGNHEYDTTNQLLIQFARTGDPHSFHLGETAARHGTEVDVVHHVNADLADYFNANWRVAGYPPRAGMVHEHAVGHVGAFYPIETIRELFISKNVGGSKTPYLCLDPFNLGHIWTQGFTRYHFLSGDDFARETVMQIGDNLARLVEDGEYQFGINDPHYGRVAGWTLLALAGAYEIDLDERYLRAMRTIVDAALGRQDPHCGGWIYPLYPGHCYCVTAKHVGAAGFITAVLINGLSRYYVLTRDERIPGAVERAVTYLNEDTWREEKKGWRYTSCPASSFGGQPGVTVMALVNAVRLAGNPEHARILKIAWEEKFRRLMQAPPPRPGQGKEFSATIYGCGDAAALLAARSG